MSGKQREKWIDLAKCIAILIVMLNHSQLTIPGVSFWGGMFFVPVFFVLSGYTYRGKEESFALFLGRKAKRLLVPYITANGILFAFFFIKDVVLSGKPAEEMLTSLIGIFYARNQLFSWETQTMFFPKAEGNIYFLTCLNSPTWFLPALFLTMVLFELLFRVCRRNGRKMLLAAVILLCLANLYHYLFPLLLPWSVDAVPYFLIMFMWGYFMRRKEFLDDFDRHKWILCILLGIFLILARINGSVNYSIADYGKSTMMALYNALVSSTLLLYLCREVQRYIPKALAVAGQQTMVLLCYHLFVFSVLETILKAVIPGISHVATAVILIVVTTIGLTLLGWGKEKLVHAKKSCD